MKKICLIIPNLLPVPNILGGAIETIVTNVIEEQEKNNLLDLTVVTIYNRLAYQESKKYSHTKFIYIKKNLKYILCSGFYKLMNKVFHKDFNTYNHIVLGKIKKMNFDYIFAEGGHYNSFYEYLKYFKREQLVLHLHHKGLSNDIIDKTFSKVVGVSSYVIDKFRDSSKIKEYYLLKNCIKTSDFDKPKEIDELDQIRLKYGIDKNDFLLLYCGRLIKEKGVLELIKAVKEINKEDLKLLIVGSVNFGNGGCDEYTEDLFNEAMSDKRIIFTGYIPSNMLSSYYQVATVSVIPSLWEEAAGLVCIEAMISKKPIITTGSGGILEYVSKNTLVVGNNLDNIVSNLKDAIIKLYQKRDALLDMGEENYQVASKYSSEFYYEKLVKLVGEEWENESKE